MQLRTFKREFAKVDLKRARRKHLSRYDVLIIASMIEREVVVPRERRLVAAVVYNRLRARMPLERSVPPADPERLGERRVPRQADLA